MDNQNLRKTAEEVANLKLQLIDRKSVDSELKCSKNKIVDLEKRILKLEDLLEVC